MIRVTATQDFTIPGQPAFKAGESYDILEPLANELAERGLVEPVKKVGKGKEKNFKK